jgi:hypothetical protein
MNLLKIKNLVINLDNVAYWQAFSTKEWNKPTKDVPSADPNTPVILGEDPDDPIVIFHFVGEQEKSRPMKLGMPMSLAFLAHIKANGLLNDIQSN